MTANTTAQVTASHDRVDLSPLWEPVIVGPVTLANRVAMAAMTTGFAEGRLISEQHLDYYEERARGGLGLIITEQQTADRNQKEFMANCLTALDPNCVSRFRAVADRVHPHGTKVFAQLFGPGPQESSALDLWAWDSSWAPSELPSRSHRQVPRAITPADIAAMAANFALAAGHVADGGLDGVEIHGSHGWLLHRFLSPLFNKRTDQYGGSLENRVRVIVEIGEAIRARVGRDTALGLQLSVDDYFGEQGMTVPLALEQLKIIDATGLYDYVNLSTGNEFSDDQTLPPVEFDHVPTEEAGALAMKMLAGTEDVSRMKVLVQGGVYSVGNAARIVAGGRADLIGFARPLLEDPHMVRKAKEGRVDEIIPSVGEGTAFIRTIHGKPAVGTLNPITGREGRWGLDNLVAAEQPRRVAVVGGGPAGLEAAATAAERGHSVTLFERSGQLGGRLRLQAALPHRGRWNDAIVALEGKARRAGVIIKLGHEITADSPELAEVDDLLIATGSTWSDRVFQASRPDVESMPRGDKDRVLTLSDAIEAAVIDPTSLGRSVVIVDETANYLPLGLADALSAAGVTVVVTTGADVVGAEVNFITDVRVYDRLAKRDVHLRPGVVVDGIDSGAVTVTELWSGRRTVIENVDTLVSSTYRSSDRTLFETLAGQSTQNVRLIGDAYIPRELPEVLANAHDAAFNL